MGFTEFLLGLIAHLGPSFDVIVLALIVGPKAFTVASDGAVGVKIHPKAGLFLSSFVFGTGSHSA